MSRQCFKYCPDHPEANHNGFVPYEIWVASKTARIEKVFSDLPSPNLIRDGMDPLRNMADGRVYDSKNRFRAATKAAGCVEGGNDTAHLLKPREPIKLSRRERRESIKRAISELKNGRPAK